MAFRTRMLTRNGEYTSVESEARYTRLKSEGWQDVVTLPGAKPFEPLPAPSPLVVTLNNSFGAVSWTNQPAAETELNGAPRSRTKVDLSRYTRVRMTAAVSTAGAAGSKLRLQYATDGNTQAAWANLTEVPLDNSGQGNISAWAELPAGARGDVWLRVVGVGGDGVIDPIIGNVTAQFT